MGLFKAVFGEFGWTPPSWLTKLGRRRLLLLLGGATLCALSVVAAVRYYNSLPKPPQIVATPVPPGITPLIDDKLIPEPLLINFTVETTPQTPTLATRSVANIALLDEIITNGIAIRPAIKGTWRWHNETQLQFAPENDWPAGQEYTVTYERALFALKLDLADNETRFTTPAFTTTLDELSFHQDPIDRRVRNVVATLTFTHPVDPKSLANKLTLAMRESGTTVESKAAAVEYEITYDKDQRRAYVHSTPIDLPDEENYLTLSLSAGLAPANGPSRFTEEVQERVLIPDIGSYFQVANVDAFIARNHNDEPVQTITIEFTDRVTTSEVADKIRAWILPRSPVLDGVAKRNHYWQGPREVTTDILAQATQIKLRLNPVDEDTAALHSASLDVPENSTLYVTVEQGLRSEGEFVLSRRYDTIARTPSYPKEAKIAQSGAILPLTRDHKLSFVSRGTKSLKVDIGRLLDSQVNHLASQTSGDISSPRFTNYHFTADNLTTSTTRIIDLGTHHPSKSAFSNLDLSEFLPSGGYYFVTVQGWDRKTGRTIGSADTRFVLITDIGLLVKTNSNGTQDVFVHSIESGLPVEGAQVALLGKNGIPLMEQTTAADGHTALPSTKGMYRAKEPTVYVVRNGEDSVFMPFSRGERMLQYSRFDVGGEYNYGDTAGDKLTAALFTDRGLYRPGDSVKLAAIVKRGDWAALGALPLELDIRDPRGRVVMEKRLKLPEAGLLDSTFTTETASLTGNYNATLFLIQSKDRRRTIGHVEFKVEEFLPDRLRIRSTISGQKTVGWLSPKDLTAQVSLNNLFGTPAEDRRVSGELELKPSRIVMKSFEGFVFDDPLRKSTSSVSVIRQTLAETTTNQDGIATLPLDLNQYDKGVYQLSVFTNGFEADGGRSVSARASVMLSPLNYLLGYKTSSDLAFLTKDSTHTVSFIAVNSDASAVPLDKLTLSIVEETFVSALVQQPNGTFAYQSVKKEQPLSSRPWSVAVDGTNYRLPTDRAGSFAIKISNAKGLLYSKISFTVAGARNLAGNLERDAELQLTLNSKSFEPGETIEMEITAPYTGTGLITIERDRVYSYRWFRSTTNTSLQSIRVPKNLEGNAYVNVAFIRDLDSPEVFVSPLSYAVAPFDISRAARVIDVELEAAELVRPGATLAVNYRTSQPAKVIVYAVDEGILQVAKYKQPKPLDFFLRKKALQVNTTQIVDLILPSFEAYQTSAAPGGGEAKSLAGRNLNPFQRKTEAPVAFWSGILSAGSATRSVSFDIPDSFNGQLRLYAVAVADTALGHASNSSTVRGPFVITPNILTAAAPGDEFDVTVAVANNLEGSGASAAIELSATTSNHLQIMGEPTRVLNIDEGRESLTSYRVRALDDPGSASLSFIARLGKEQAQREATLSVRPAVAYVATVNAGVTEKSPATLEFGRTLYNQLATQSAAASASPLVLTDGLLNYLDAYPHACAEQIVSKVFPQIGFLGSQDYTVDEVAIRTHFERTVQTLRSRQNAEGGFLFWSTSREAADFPSVYIMHFLTDAKALGLPVPRDMLQGGVGYLRELAARDTQTLLDARLRAYAIYVLTRNGNITTNYLTSLHEFLDRNSAQSWHADLTATYMAASYQLLKQTRLSDRILGKYRMGAGDELVSDFDTRLGRDAQHLYLLARHFPDRLNNISPTTIKQMVEPIMQHRFNTLSSAYTILALGEYTNAARTESNDAKVGLSAITAGVNNVLIEAALYARAQINTDVESVQVNTNDDQAIYYVLSQTGFDRTPATESLAEGLELDRHYLNKDDVVVTEAKIGSELTVRLRIRSTGTTRSNVALVDMLPGGFEVLTDSVRNQYSGWQVDAKDIREDRVVIYGAFDNRITEITYKVKVTSSGSFITPSAFAGSMYDRSVQARTAPGRFEVQGL